jgi:hypothetical protein
MHEIVIDTETTGLDPLDGHRRAGGTIHRLYPGWAIVWLRSRKLIVRSS